MRNEAESQAVFAVSYVRNVRGRVMSPDSTVHVFLALQTSGCLLLHESSAQELSALISSTKKQPPV